jgi:flagellar protein FliT
MSTNPSVLQQYQIIAAISAQMLAQARLNQWNSVIRLGRKYNEEVELLRHMDPLSDQDRQLRKGLLAQILNNDAHIRNLAAPELARLSMLLGAMKRQQTVRRAYASPAAQHP